MLPNTSSTTTHGSLGDLCRFPGVRGAWQTGSPGWQSQTQLKWAQHAHTQAHALSEQPLWRAFLGFSYRVQFSPKKLPQTFLLLPHDDPCAEMGSIALWLSSWGLFLRFPWWTHLAYIDAVIWVVCCLSGEFLSGMIKTFSYSFSRIVQKCFVILSKIWNYWNILIGLKNLCI